MKYLPKIALGAWAWGNDGTFGSSFTSDQLRPIFEAAMKNGLNLWDTAEHRKRCSRDSLKTCREKAISYPTNSRRSALTLLHPLLCRI